MKAKAILYAMLLSGATAAQAVEPCLEQAAVEFGIPAKVLDAMRQEHTVQRNASMAQQEFGPMGLGQPAIQLAERKAGIDNAKADACQNYRAAAWFLDGARKRAGGDLWHGVGLYYVGDMSSEKRKSLGEVYIARIKKVAGES